MAVLLRWDGDLRFVASNENGVQVTLEPGPQFGGSGKFMTPMEMLAVSLGACSGMDVVLILQKMRVDLKKTEMEIQAKRRREEPRYYEEIKIIYKFSGEGLTEEKARKAVELTHQKYCSVGVMLQDKAKITYEVRME